MIPPRIKLTGDVNKAKSWLDLARDQLSILHRVMKFQSLKQLTRKVSFEDGTVIDVRSSFGLDVVSVYTPPAAGVEEAVEEITLVLEGEPEGAISETRAGTAALDVGLIFAPLPPGVWTLTETGLDPLPNDGQVATCDGCVLGGCWDPAGACNVAFTCYSASGWHKWKMLWPFCLVDDNIDPCDCSCFDFNSWRVVITRVPALHPPNCAGFGSNNPCDLNLNACDDCAGQGPGSCISCAYTRYEYSIWTPV